MARTLCPLSPSTVQSLRCFAHQFVIRVSITLRHPWNLSSVLLPEEHWSRVKAIFCSKICAILRELKGLSVQSKKCQSAFTLAVTSEKCYCRLMNFSKRIICHRAKEVGGGKRVITDVTAAPASLTNTAPADNSKWISAEQIPGMDSNYTSEKTVSLLSHHISANTQLQGFCGWSLDHLLSQTEQEQVNPLLAERVPVQSTWLHTA